eukprot:scaffold795_cov115-Isochrysis_galbana.AAC.2
MAAPRRSHKALQADVYQLLWERDPSFDVEHVGTDSSAYKWIKRDQRKTITSANAPWGHNGNLKEGTSPEGKGR